MIERGTFRPGNDIIDLLCSKLWIDKNWLVTGVGHMDRTELTPFYELLKRDPAVRAHIKSFIEHLDHPKRIEEEIEQEIEQQNNWVRAYVVNDVSMARLFLNHYNIEYKEEVDYIVVRQARDIDHERATVVEKKLRRIGLANMCEHKFIWRDRDENILVTFSPYDVEDVRQTWIEKTKHNFYGYGSTTFVVRC